jgi:glyoxylase-like metal-dependent hydrolase (beta-lactamase superfamily II)
MSNCIILADLDTSREALIIDPGDEADKILSLVIKHKLKVRYILHTHGHLDHISATRRVAEQTGAPIYLHREDKWLYDNLVQQASNFGLEAQDPLPLHSYLREGDKFSFGSSRIEVMHTPGHSPGSVCFLVPRKEADILISGDTLFASSIGRTDLWKGSFEQLIGSIKARLMPLPEDTLVLPGHGPQTTIGYERESNPFLRG